jgi:hypothetical protein
MSIKQSGTGITTTRVATGFTFGFDTADYGGTFGTYTPPTASGDIELRVVQEQNGSDTFRLYIWQKEVGAWKYVALS